MVDSISKTAVSRDVAEGVVADAFDGGARLAALHECTEGWFNAAYRLTLTDGRRCVLKVAPPPDVTVLTYEHDIMATEVAALRLVRDRTSVPVPAVLWSDTSCRRVPSPLFVMEHCEGTLLSELRPELDVAQQQSVDAQLAGFLREMHSITHDRFGLQAPSAASFERWSEAFVHLLDSVLADGEAAAVPLPVEYDVIRALSRAEVAALDEVTQPRFVHWDLWDTNVFVDPVSLRVTGIIDFERALWGDPLMEGQFLSKGRDEAFLAAYGNPVLAGPAARRRRLLYDLYLFVIMVVESTYRRYPTDDIETFARGRLTATLAALGVNPPEGRG